MAELTKLLAKLNLLLENEQFVDVERQELLGQFFNLAQDANNTLSLLQYKTLGQVFYWSGIIVAVILGLVTLKTMDEARKQVEKLSVVAQMVSQLQQQELQDRKWYRMAKLELLKDGGDADETQHHMGYN